MSEVRLVDLRVATNAVGCIDTSKPWDDKDDVIEQAIAILDRLPTIEPPVVRGRWITVGHYPPHCSNCEGITPKDAEGESFYQSDFCQSCGADMRGAK